MSAHTDRPDDDGAAHTLRGLHTFFTRWLVEVLP